MKKNKYFFMGVVYVCCFLSIIIFVFTKWYRFNNKLVILDDKKESIKRLQQSVPVKIQISNEKWGELEIKDSKEVLKIWDYINSISDVKTSPSNTSFVDDNGYDEVEGTISYLNGEKGNWYIGNIFKIDNYIYGYVNSNPEIMYLKNRLIERLYTINNLCNFINKNNKVVIVDNKKREIKLGNKDKETLKRCILNCNKIKGSDKLKNYIKDRGELLYQIRIYTDKENTNNIKTNNIINVIVYENNYSVVIDLCNIKGNLMYISGDINKICDEIVNRY